jgi:hypothetical protein
VTTIGALEAAATLAPFWDRVAAQVEAKGFFTKALRSARLLDEPALAAVLLRPFRLEMLTTSHAKAMSALVDSYGELWAGELVAAWSAKRRFYNHQGPSPESWMASLPRLCLAFGEAGEAGTSAARLLLRDSWRWVSQAIDRPRRRPGRLRHRGRQGDSRAATERGGARRRRHPLLRGSGGSPRPPCARERRLVDRAPRRMWLRVVR